MSKQVASKPTTALAAVAPQTESTAVLSRQDELFSVARIIQAMSKPETCENPAGPPFTRGDVVVYPQRYKIGGYKKPFSVIFLRNTLEWANFEIVGAKEEWRSEEPRIDRAELEGGNEHWPLEFTHDGKKMKRYRQITLYVLLPEQVEAFMKDALSDAPALSGSVQPLALKSRNYSRKSAQEIINVIGGKEFQLRNAMRSARGLPTIPVFAYEHTLEPMDKTNSKGTFQILAYKGSCAVKNPEVQKMAAALHATLARATTLKTVIVEESQSSGQVSDEV